MILIFTCFSKKQSCYLEILGHTFKVGPSLKKKNEVRGPLDFAASFLDHLGLGGPNSGHRALSPPVEDGEVLLRY